MSTELHSNRTSVGSALSLIALLAWTCAALAQPAPGGPPPLGGPGGETSDAPSSGAILMPELPPLPADAPEPSLEPRSFDGVWTPKPSEFRIRTDMFGDKPPFTAAGQKVMNRRLQANKDGTPYLNASAHCLPVGQPWQMAIGTFHVFQSKDFIDVQSQDYHGFYEITMDPAEALPPGYMGSAAGRWDGNTLVVEISGFKDALWLDPIGTPASKNAKLTQRIRKVKTDQWFLEVVFTLDDPNYYTRPWSWVRAYSWRPDLTLFAEFNCEIQTAAPYELYPGMIPEPQD